MRGHPIILVASIAALAASSCGGGGDDAAPASITPSTSAPATTAAPTTVETSPTSIAPTTAPETTAPPTTAPPTTEPAPPPTTEPEQVSVTLGDTVTAAAGLVSMQVAQGWEVTSTEDFIATGFEDSEGLAWEASEDTLQELVILERGDVLMSVFRETRFGLLDNVFEWDSGLAAVLGVQPNISLTREWAGGRGNSTQGRLGTAYIRLDTVQVGDQFVGTLALSADQPTAQLNAEVEAMTESMIVDPSVVGPLSHVIDLTTTVTNETAAGPESFAISVLAPPTWTEDPDVTAYWTDPSVDPESDVVPSLDVYTLIDPDLTLDGYITQEFLDRAQAWLSVEPVIEERATDVAPMTIFWEGEPGEAEAAVVMTGANDMFVAAYIWVPGDPTTTFAMVESVLLTLTP